MGSPSGGRSLRGPVSEHSGRLDRRDRHWTQRAACHQQSERFSTHPQTPLALNFIPSPAQNSISSFSSHIALSLARDCAVLPYVIGKEFLCSSNGERNRPEGAILETPPGRPARVGCRPVQHRGLAVAAQIKRIFSAREVKSG